MLYMALSFYDQDSYTDHLSHSVENFLGIDIHHYGQNTMTPAQIKTFRETLGALHKDYPEVFGSELKQINLIHNANRLPQNESQLSKAVFSRFKNSKDINETALTVPNIPGVIEGSMSFHMPNIEMNQIIGGSQSGWMVKGAENNLLQENINHEFGHVLHHFLVSPGEENLLQDPTLTGRNIKVQNAVNNSLPIIEENAQKLGITPENIGSGYSVNSTKEFFAEIFARSRSGTGRGLKQSRLFEKTLIAPDVKEVAKELGLTRKEKMLSNTKNMYKVLRSMGSGLR